MMHQSLQHVDKEPRHPASGVGMALLKLSRVVRHIQLVCASHRRGKPELAQLQAGAAPAQRTDPGLRVQCVHTRAA